jgi:hypothetical protein
LKAKKQECNQKRKRLQTTIGGNKQEIFENKIKSGKKNRKFLSKPRRWIVTKAPQREKMKEGGLR